MLKMKKKFQSIMNKMNYFKKLEIKWKMKMKKKKIQMITLTSLKMIEIIII